MKDDAHFKFAERFAALGSSPQGTPGAIIKDRDWDDYSVGRDTSQAHLAALDLVYNGVIEDIRHGIEETEELDRVTQDILIGHAIAELVEKAIVYGSSGIS